MSLFYLIVNFNSLFNNKLNLIIGKLNHQRIYDEDGVYQSDNGIVLEDGVMDQLYLTDKYSDLIEDICSRVCHYRIQSS